MMAPSRYIAASVVLGCLTSSIHTAAETGPIVEYDYELDYPAVTETPAATMEDAAAPMQQTVTDAAVFSVMVADFSMFPAVDYVPNMEPAPMVGVEDVGDATVVDAVECAQQCAELVDCNAASYYGDNPPETWPGGKNCWMKTLVGCDVPPDATPTADDTIFLIGGPSCAGALTPMPAPAVDVSVSPMASPLDPTLTAPSSAIPAVPAVPAAPTVLSEAASPMATPVELPIAAAAPSTVADAPLGEPQFGASAPVSTVSEQSGGLNAPPTSEDALAAVPAPPSSSTPVSGCAFSMVLGGVLVLAAALFIPEPLY